MKNKPIKTFAAGRIVDDYDRFGKFQENSINTMNYLVDSSLSREFINRELEYNSIPRDCRTCQNMNCKVENYEKPIYNCLDYIHHIPVDKEKKRTNQIKKKKN